MQWLTVFCITWRAHLLGERRVWHPHHYLNVLGQRADQLVVRPSAQNTSLSKVVGLLESLFSRGARVWGFGVYTPQAHPCWGLVWKEWLPGQLTNSVFQRYKRNYFVRQAINLSRRRKVYRTGRRRPLMESPLELEDQDFDAQLKSISFRRNALRSCNNRVAKDRVLLTVALAEPLRPFMTDLLNSPYNTNRIGRSAIKAHLLKVNAVQPIFTKVGLRRLKPTTFYGLGVRSFRLVTCRHRLAHRRQIITQRRRRRPQSHRPFREGANYQNIPFRFPSAIVAVGFGSNRSLLSEANTANIPVVYFHNSGISPMLSPFSVVWGTDLGRGQGLYYLINQCYQRVWNNCFLNTVWARIV